MSALDFAECRRTPIPLRILPLASSLNPPGDVRATVAAIAGGLRRHGIEPEILERGARGPDALLVVTGGTEHLALDALRTSAGPVILIAHPELNSLPAALEILGRLRQVGQRGRIRVLDDGPGGFASLARVARCLDARRRLASARLGLIGPPSDWLVASVPDPRTVEAVWGPAVVDVPVQELLEARRRVDASAADRIRRDVVSAACRVGEPTPADLDAASTLAAALELVVAERALDACAVRCFDLLATASTTGCLALSWLADRGTVAACEGDVAAAVTMMWVQAMTGSPTFMANPQVVRVETGTVTLAHCTIPRRMVSSYALRSHFESSIGVGIAGTLEPGDATLARVGGTDLRGLFVSDGSITAGGDHPRRCRTQVDVQLGNGAGELLARPLGNHLVLARGHWALDLREYHGLLIARDDGPAARLSPD